MYLTGSAWSIQKNIGLPICLMILATTTLLHREPISLLATKGGQVVKINVERIMEDWQRNNVLIEPSEGNVSRVKPMDNFQTTMQHMTFTNTAYDMPFKVQLEPDLNGYLKPYKQEIREFLKLDLTSHPEKATFLSKKLRTHNEIIAEAQRLHFHIIGGVLKGFKYAVVFDIAEQENKGDPAITVGEIFFLQRIGLKIVYYCSTSTCNLSYYKQAARVMTKKYTPEDLVILLHGGGNIVGYYERDHERFHIINLFRGYKIVSFPNSVYMRDYNDSGHHMSRCEQYYCCNENLTLILRDEQSYNLAKKHFEGKTTLLMAPDMAFQIGYVQRFVFAPDSYKDTSTVIFASGNDYRPASSNRSHLSHDFFPSNDYIVGPILDNRLTEEFLKRVSSVFTISVCLSDCLIFSTVFLI